jgi:hypothetical protein
MVDRARKATINYGGIDLEVYQLPDGSYKLSQTQTAQAIGHTEANVRNRLKKDTLQVTENLDSEQGLTIVQRVKVEGSTTWFNAVPFKWVVAYWSSYAEKGNVKAKALLAAGAEETLTRLADQAFGIQKTEAQYHQETVANVQQNEQMFLMMQQMMQQMENQSNMINNLSVRFEEVERQNSLMLPDHIKMSGMREAFEAFPNLEEILNDIAEYLRVTPNPDYFPLKHYLRNVEVTQGERITLGMMISGWLKMIVGAKLPKKYEYQNSPNLYPECVTSLVDFGLRLIRR